MSGTGTMSCRGGMAAYRKDRTASTLVAASAAADEAQAEGERQLVEYLRLIGVLPTERECH